MMKRKIIIALKVTGLLTLVVAGFVAYRVYVIGIFPYTIDRPYVVNNNVWGLPVVPK